MKAMTVKDEKLILTDVEMPNVNDNEIRIKVKAIGINRADLLQKKGTYPSPKGWPEWPGLEVAGIVDAMGEGAKQKGRFKSGDSVCALLGGGGYAEYVCAPEGMVMPIPENLSLLLKKSNLSVLI